MEQIGNIDFTTGRTASPIRRCLAAIGFVLTVAHFSTEPCLQVTELNEGGSVSLPESEKSGTIPNLSERSSTTPEPFGTTDACRFYA